MSSSSYLGRGTPGDYHDGPGRSTEVPLLSDSCWHLAQAPGAPTVPLGLQHRAPLAYSSDVGSGASSRLSLVTKSVGVHEAKTHLSRLLQEVGAGEEVVITSRGREVARLVPPRRAREFGLDRGRFVVPDDFDAPLSDDELRAFGA